MATPFLRALVALVALGLLTTTARADEIFDGHVHLMSPDNWPRPITVETVTPLLDAAKVNRAVLLSAAYRLTDEKKARVENDFIAEREAIAWYLRKLGIDHVVFGSDFPVFTPAVSLAALAKYGFTPAELTGIRGANLTRILDEARKAAAK